MEECTGASETLLKKLDFLGYKVSAKKAEVCLVSVTYLEYCLHEGSIHLDRNEFRLHYKYSPPRTEDRCRNSWELQDIADFGFLVLQRWLSHSMQPLVRKGVSSSGDQLKAFQELQKALISALVLALPHVTKSLFFMHENKGIAKGVLTQALGSWRPGAYFSKRLDSVASRWPNCLRAIAATALLVKEASKLMLGQDLQIIRPHGVEALLRSPQQIYLKCVNYPVPGIVTGHTPCSCNLSEV